MTANSIAVLKVTLDDVKPVVQRRLAVPIGIRLDRLHLVLQAALGWTNSHLYEFKARDVGWGMPDPDFGDGPLDARKARLIDVLEDVGVKTIKYLYDFGDGWEHTVKLERVTPVTPGLASPFLIDAAGRCPPEDVGGSWGYSEFLEILADPTHEEHAHTKAWAGGDFNPNIIHFEQLADAVSALAKRWTRKPPVKRRLSS